jgi:hypothetical protein
MIITYFRSSSYNAHSMCEQQYFLEYVLGWRGPSNKKADKGTIVHKVLEVLAVIKKAEQDKLLFIDDDIVGKINVSNYNLDEIIKVVYTHYSNANSHHQWVDKDFSECYNWVYKTLNYNKGMFDPRNRFIVQPEQHFDFIIEKPWAKYSYKTEDGLLEGYLGLKGTIDLITKVNDDLYEIVDWKTGKRLDWATGQEKTQEKLEKDPQLRIYHYAIRHLYPEIAHFMVSINFINDGGVFSMSFDDKDLIETEQMLMQKFEIIKKTKKPRLKKTWMCSKLCHFGKTTFEDTNILPTIEYRNNQVCSKGSTMTKCEQIKHDIELLGIDEVTKNYKHKNHTFGHYEAPGQ